MKSIIGIVLLFAVAVRCDEGQREVDLFHRADANNDTHLTRVELDTVFLLFDLNNDSKITPTEFVQDWVHQYNIGGETEAQVLFTRADTNDDGVIDVNDLPAIFSYFDMDSDGLVDISEFLTQWGDLKLHPVDEIAVSIDIG